MVGISVHNLRFFVLNNFQKLYKFPMEKFIMTFDVSRETIDRLKSYEASLYEWQ